MEYPPFPRWQFPPAHRIYHFRNVTKMVSSAPVLPLLNKLSAILRKEISSISFSAHFGIYIV
jgi:hypothetical protein